MIPGKKYKPEDFLEAAWRRRWFIMVPLVVISAVTMLVVRRLPDRYESLSVTRYGNVDGKPTIALSGRPYPGVTEQMQFDRESGLLLRRTITTATPLGPLPEQIDYSDYRDVSGVKVPFVVRYVTWRDVTTEKLSDVKFNVPIAADEFAKPAGTR